MKHTTKLYLYKIIASILVLTVPASPALVFGLEKVGSSVLIGKVPWTGGILMKISEIYLFLFEFAVLFILTLSIFGAFIWVLVYIWNVGNNDNDAK